MAGMDIRVDSNLSAWTRAMTTFRRRQRAAIIKANFDTAEDMLATMHRHASGRPGPEVRTGAFNRSLFVEADGLDGFNAGSTADYARRLELGFVGVDSIGRHYQQPAYPWLQPSAEEVFPRYAERMRRAVHGEF